MHFGYFDKYVGVDFLFFQTIMSEYVGELRREGYSIGAPAGPDASPGSDVAAKTLRGILDVLARAKSSVHFQIGAGDPHSVSPLLGRGGSNGLLKEAFSSAKTALRPIRQRSMPVNNKVREPSKTGRTSTARSILKSRFGKSKSNEK
jgi:hypothetical protein